MPAGELTLLAFLEADCPTCALTIPYLGRLAERANVIGISQDSEAASSGLRARMDIRFPLVCDKGLELSRAFDPQFVPALFLIDRENRVAQAQEGFDKAFLNAIAGEFGQAPVADAYDGNPASKPGCSSRHVEPATEAESAAPVDLYSARGRRATLLEAPEAEDPFEYCFREFGDGLPVIPPTPERVERLLRSAGLAPEEVVARVPPCYGEATVEKIAANAVMAGCMPEMMRVLIPLVRAACDERFNAHGVQATTHFAAPLIIVNGPVRKELGFAAGQNVFSNVARANSTLGRALQLILLNIGGARPDGIDMSALGNPGKFSYCIAENEEENPWEPLHVELGFGKEQSAVTLFAGEPPRGVSEHTARTPGEVLRAISYALATVWSYRGCLGYEAIVILGPEHARTIHRGRWSKQQVRDFLFENTGIPVREYDGQGGEGTQLAGSYRRIEIRGEPCYQKFRSPDQIRIVVSGGTAGKFSAVLGSWSTGPRGSQMVTYPV